MNAHPALTSNRIKNSPAIAGGDSSNVDCDRLSRHDALRSNSEAIILFKCRRGAHEPRRARLTALSRIQGGSGSNNKLREVTATATLVNNKETTDTRVSGQIPLLVQDILIAGV
jgi:hypothetical protein